MGETQEFWKKYKKLYNKNGDKIIGNLICPDSQQLKSQDSEKEELLFNKLFWGKHLKEANFDSDHFEKIKSDLDNLKSTNFTHTDESTTNLMVKTS